MVTDVTKINETKSAMLQRIPNAKLEDDSAGALIYQLPPSSTPYIADLVKWLDLNPQGLIKAWGISQTTLEEVFLKLIRDANPGGYGYVNSGRQDGAIITGNALQNSSEGLRQRSNGYPKNPDAPIEMMPIKN